MALYDVTSGTTTAQASATAAAAALVVLIDAITDTKTFYYTDIIREGANFYGVIIYDE